MTTDRFYGGVDGRLRNLQEMLSYVDQTAPSEADLIDWIITNTRANSEDAVRKHLGFIQAIGMLDDEQGQYRLGEYGQRYLEDPDPDTVFEALTSGVKGFQTILQELSERPMTDKEMMDLLVASFEECEMETPGPAQRHREWLQAIGYLERANGVNRITEAGRDAVTDSSSFNFVPGKEYRRQELHDEYGGRRQSGISMSAQEPIVFLFMGASGEKYGYQDEIQADGRVIYTGEGVTGDMTFDHGNKAIRDHQKDGRELHLFRITDDGMVAYEEQYEYVDHVRETLPDRDGNDRSAIRFELQPVDHEPEDTSLAEALEEQDRPGQIELPDGNAETQRQETVRESVQRDNTVVREMKRLYNHTCQLCGDRRLQAPATGFSYVHHIKPLGSPHNGPDVPENTVVVCPNHHDDFDNGMLTVDPETLEINHEYEEELTGEQLTTKADHEIGDEYLRYHNQEIADTS